VFTPLNGVNFLDRCPVTFYLNEFPYYNDQFGGSMFLVRLLNTPIRVGLNSSAVRANKHWEKVAFNTATVFAVFGIGVSTMGLTQLAMRNSHKLQ
jgi:hypothetical protein